MNSVLEATRSALQEDKMSAIGIDAVVRIFKSSGKERKKVVTIFRDGFPLLSTRLTRVLPSVEKEEERKLLIAEWEEIYKVWADKEETKVMGTYSIKPASQEQDTIRVPTDHVSYLNVLVPFKYAPIGKTILIGSTLYHKATATEVFAMSENKSYTVDPLVLCMEVLTS
jgi:hypothetical protein